MNIKIGLDIMSGENPPSELIEGCLEAIGLYNVDLYVIGNQDIIKECLKNQNSKFKKNLHIIHADSVIGMDEAPSEACRRKKDASVVVGCNHLSQGTFNSFFSPGNTGATLTASLFNVGRIKGVKRPAIGTPIPNAKNRLSYVIDAGANTDCHWRYLKQFAIMGNIFYKNLFDVDKPKIGILNIGEEEGKGNELTARTFKELSKLPLNFIGNIEPSDIYNGNCDIAVCDGFVGNIFLKSSESIAKRLTNIIKDEVAKKIQSKIGAFLMKDVFQKIKNNTDANSFGGAPLLGIRKPVFIGHGKTNSEGIINIVKHSVMIIQSKATEQIEKDFAIHA